MAEPLKNLIDADAVGAISHHLHRVWTGFDHRAFTRQALAGLDALELKARVMQAAGALVAALPADVDRAAGILEASLGPAGAGDDLAGLRTSAAGLAGWPVWPLTEAITLLAARQHPARGLQALHAMTQRLTAEFAIRPFLIHHPEIGFATLARWVNDPSAHVRRLVSEGSRPRLPWGLRLQALVADPAATLPLLAQLQDDGSGYVRRSVANHLNDIAKDHPAVLVQWLQNHLPDATAARQQMLRHACRTLVKAGHPQVLQAWGLGAPFKGQAALQLSSAQVQLGSGVALKLALKSTSPDAQNLVVDYAVHHVKANGSTSAKVFKGWKLQLPAGGTVQLSKQHAVRPISTRSYHAGWHAVQVQINGSVVAETGFDLLL